MFEGQEQTHYMRRDNQMPWLLESAMNCIIIKNVLRFVWEMAFFLFFARDWAKYVASILAPTQDSKVIIPNVACLTFYSALSVSWRAGYRELVCAYF